MTIDRTPMNAPETHEYRPGGCSAYGCPMPGSVKLGSDWVCGFHANAPATDWQQITARLNQRKPLVRAMLRAMAMDPYEFAKGRHIAAGTSMAKFGRPDLAPTTVTLRHKTRDRHTGAEIELVIERDERESLKLWAMRLHATLGRECASGIPAPQQPETQASAAAPQTVADFLPEFAHG